MQMRHVLVFVRENALRIFLVSTLILVPCFWHKSIEAGDIPSHTYNAWLALLIKQGKAPGLYVESRWNNILVDWTLEKLGTVLGFVVAERAIVVISVLIFFWGAFALISAANRRPPWYLVPALAMITYGWTFYSGFLNFYLSLGLAFFTAALILRRNKLDWLLASLIGVLVLVAHPLGFVCLIGLAAYFRLADILSGWLRWALFASAFLVVLLVHFYTLRLHTEYTHTNDFYLMNGADQLVLFQAHYVRLAWAVLVFGIFCFVYGVLREWKSEGDRWAFRTPLELWTVLLFTAAMIPEVLWFSQEPMPFSLAISRLTSVTAVLGICVLGSLKPRLWHLASFAIIAAVFFVWTYQDTGTLNKMERQVESMVSTLPYGRRVVETINFAPDCRLWFINHIVDRACIGKCFTYSNYEPATRQFRIRVHAGSPIVTDSVEDSAKMESGFYVAREQDLPMNQIYQCDERDLSKLCIRDLSTGEENGRLGYRPPPIQ
jgi:hypothetical protein